MRLVECYFISKLFNNELIFSANSITKGLRVTPLLADKDLAIYLIWMLDDSVVYPERNSLQYYVTQFWGGKKLFMMTFI